jgi:pimeloyl-ACP methyl ester carboxylesterase
VGRPTPVVLVHDGRCTGAIWSRMTPLLARRSLAVDLPGRNDPASHAEASFSGWARAVVDDMDAADMDRAVLIGHSMAGGTLAAMARLYPERAAAVVCFSAVVPPNGRPFIEGLSEQQQAYMRANRDAGAITLPRSPVGEDEALTADRAFVKAAESDEALRPFFEPVSLEGLANTRLGFVKLTQDRSIEVERQDVFIDRMRAFGPCAVREVAANHMAMANSPAPSAEAIESVIAALELDD